MDARSQPTEGQTQDSKEATGDYQNLCTSKMNLETLSISVVCYVSLIRSVNMDPVISRRTDGTSH